MTSTKQQSAEPAPAAAPQEQQDDIPASCNEVRIVGRLSKLAQERELPSGDLLVTFVVVVDRPKPARARAARSPSGRAQSVDNLDCVAWTAGSRRRAIGLAAGDLVEVTGSLRRRFWSAGAMKVSRCEVEVASVRRLVRARRS